MVHFKLLTFSTIALAAASKIDLLKSQDWQNFKINFNKNYVTVNEEFAHFKTFKENLIKVSQHNAININYKLEINSFSDLTEDQFAEQRLMKTKNIKSDGGLPYPEEDSQFECPHAFQSQGLPAAWSNSLDWRTNATGANPLNLRAVTPVKDQAQCGSCYSFSSTGAIEGSLCIKGIKTCDDNWSGISEQHILNCGSVNKNARQAWYGFNGCYGGWQSNVYEFLHQAQGVVEDKDFPYMSGSKVPEFNIMNVGECYYTPANQFTWMQKNAIAYVDKDICGTTNKNGNTNSTLLQEALFRQGPLAMGMYVGGTFSSYKSGVYVPASGDCPNYLSTGINHAMLLVGYGHSDTDNLDYWIVKNSWGSSWGDNGFIKVVRGQNACGIEGNTAYVNMMAA